MFRLHDNVPEVYIQQSRDFQLISRVYDAVVSGIKYDTDTIVNLLDASKARDSILPLMCTKIGFFTREELDAQVLKYIIASFPHIIKHKGTQKGIELAVNTILKAENITESFDPPRVVINNNETSVYHTKHTVYIYTTIEVYNRVALRELLKYVLPIGYSYQLLSYASLTDETVWSDVVHGNEAKIYQSYTPYISRVAGKDKRQLAVNDPEYKYGSAYDMAEVYSKDVAQSASNNYEEDPVIQLYPKESITEGTGG